MGKNERNDAGLTLPQRLEEEPKKISMLGQTKRLETVTQQFWDQVASVALLVQG
jgi:hypothetical protein